MLILFWQNINLEILIPKVQLQSHLEKEMKKNTNVIEVISFLLISILQYNNAKCASCLVTKKKKNSVLEIMWSIKDSYTNLLDNNAKCAAKIKDSYTNLLEIHQNMKQKVICEASLLSLEGEMPNISAAVDFKILWRAFLDIRHNIVLTLVFLDCKLWWKHLDYIVKQSPIKMTFFSRK
jgi:hypothetical protein